MKNDLPLVIYDEIFLLERIKGNKEFHPHEISIIFIKEGRIELSVNGDTKKYSKTNIIFISPRNIYQLKQISKDIQFYIIDVQSLLF